MKPGFASFDPLGAARCQHLRSHARLRFFQPFGFLPGVDHPMNHREIREHGNHPQHRRRPTLRLHGEAARIAGQLGVRVISLSPGYYNEL